MGPEDEKVTGIAGGLIAAGVPGVNGGVAGASSELTEEFCEADTRICGAPQAGQNGSCSSTEAPHL